MSTPHEQYPLTFSREKLPRSPPHSNADNAKILRKKNISSGHMIYDFVSKKKKIIPFYGSFFLVCVLLPLKYVVYSHIYSDSFFLLFFFIQCLLAFIHSYRTVGGWAAMAAIFCHPSDKLKIVTYNFCVVPFRSYRAIVVCAFFSLLLRSFFP